MKTLSVPAPPSTPVHTTTRAEVELVLYCARTQLAPEKVERVKHLLTLELDWKLIIVLATQHRVLALLFHNLKQIAPSKIPPEVFAHLQTFFSGHIFRNLNQTAEIVRIIDLLKQHNIPAIPFKGPTLALAIYGDIKLRQFDDLDILVSQSDFLKARQVLIDKGGYQRPTPSPFLIPKQEIAHLRSAYECSLIHPTYKTLVDLHQNLTGGTFILYPFDAQDLWKDLVPVSQTDGLLTLHSEDLLLYLCTHGTKSLWQRLVWICDVAEFVNVNPELDWEHLLQKAQKANLERMLLLGLQLARQLLGTELPSIVNKRIETEPTVQALAQQVERRILSGECGLQQKFTVSKLWFQCQAIADPKEQIQYCLRCFHRHGLVPIKRLLTPTKKDWLFIQLPKPLYSLYYLIRPVRLLRNTAKNAWQNSHF
ncbi:MAG: nucleotidyltransferase family protein [Cyanobacteria bacterium J06636_16]